MILMLLRDIALSGGMIVAGVFLGAWTSDIHWTVSTLVLLISFALGFQANTIFHEWGHVAFARMTGAVAPLLSLKDLFPIFHFDIGANTTNQFLSMSIGGNLLQWLVVISLVWWLDGSNNGEIGIMAGAFGFAVGATVVEGRTIINTVRLGSGQKAWDAYRLHRRRNALIGFVVGVATAVVVFSFLYL